MGILEGLGLFSVAVNVIGAVWGFFTRKKAKTAREALIIVSDGLKVLEEVIEVNKDVLDKTSVGKQITAGIKKYGPVVTEAVDTARKLAHIADKQAYEIAQIAEEIQRHKQQVAARRNL